MRVVTPAMKLSAAIGSSVLWPPLRRHLTEGAGWSDSATAEKPEISACRASCRMTSGSRNSCDAVGNSLGYSSVYFIGPPENRTRTRTHTVRVTVTCRVEPGPRRSNDDHVDTLRSDRHRRGLLRSICAAPSARTRRPHPCAGDGRKRRRDLVVQPVSGCALRHREHRVLL